MSNNKRNKREERGERKGKTINKKLCLEQPDKIVSQGRLPGRGITSAQY